jgi:DUF1009 family protein
MPSLVAASAQREGHTPIVFAIAGEADPTSFDCEPVRVYRWGQLGSMLRAALEAGCREAVFIGTVSKRPDIATVRPDLSTVKFVPRVLKLIGQGDHALLDGMTQIFAEHGIALVGALDIAPELALPEGCVTGEVSPDAERDIEKALEAAQLIGKLDIAQGAVSVGGRVVALEDAGGTDGLLERVADYRSRRIIGKAGGVLVKCLKPQQDGRHDLPTIGPATAEGAARAGLLGVVAEAERTLLVGRDETVEAFRRSGLFLLGIKTLG